MKILIMAAITAMFGFVGYGIAKIYTERKKFFYDFVRLIKNLKNEINFSMDKLQNVIGKLRKEIRNITLITILNNYLFCLNNKKCINYKELFKNVNLLNEQEKESIYIFFSRLGKIDVFNQIDSLENSSKIFEEYYIQAKSESAKYSPLFTKLGILSGIFVALIIA